MGISDSVVYNGVTFTTGDKVTCFISNYRIYSGIIIDAKIYVTSKIEGDALSNKAFKDGSRLIYVCQNIHRGSDSPDLLNYKYSYAGIIIYEKGKYDHIDLGISDLKKISYNIFEDIPLIKKVL